MNTHHEFLRKCITQLEKLMVTRMSEVTKKISSPVDIPTIPPKLLHHFRMLLIKSNLLSDKSEIGQAEFFTLMIAFVPYIQPDFFDSIINREFPKAGNFPLFGGIRGKNNRGLIPTGDTTIFLLAGLDFKKRLEVSKIFYESHCFYKDGLLRLEEGELGEPTIRGRLILSSDVVQVLLNEKISLPKFGKSFPAQHISTSLNLDDLVINPSTLNQLYEIEGWMKHGSALNRDKNLGKHLKKGYRALFHGTPGTGKTIAAITLGKRNNQAVFRIDLSVVVSKYIGETEKNLSNLFDKAEHKNWILFFDEADAMFGKRATVKDAHDRFANQEIAYLLQRIENYNGLIIMATNMMNNIDDAFLRRFQSIVYFPLPSADERIEIFRSVLPDSIQISPDLDIESLGKKFKLSGSSIVNAIQYCSLRALSKTNGKGKGIIQLDDLIIGIQRELSKDGRTIH